MRSMFATLSLPWINLQDKFDVQKAAFSCSRIVQRYVLCAVLGRRLVGVVTLVVANKTDIIIQNVCRLYDEFSTWLSIMRVHLAFSAVLKDGIFCPILT